VIDPDHAAVREGRRAQPVLDSTRVMSFQSWWGPSYIALYGVVCLAATASIGFHVGLNDFWGNLALADQLEWSSPASWYNQFFPFGYTLLLRVLGPEPVVPAHLLNVTSGLALLAVVWGFTRRLLGEPWALCAIAMLSIHPQVFRYVTTPGPDMPAAALAAIGFARAFASADDGRRWTAFAAGAWFGAGALLRYHALVFGGLTIVATAIGHAAPRRHLRLAFTGLLAVYVAQMTVAMLAHHSPFHTGQAYIFHKLVHGVNWFHVTSETTPSSVLEVIRASPGGFASAYLEQLALLWPLPIAPALLALAAVDTRSRRFGRIAFLIVTGYSLIVATGGSSRGSLPIRFLVVMSAVALAQAIVMRAGVRDSWLSTRTRTAVLTGSAIVLLALWILPWLREDYGTFKFRARDHAAYEQVEALLRDDGTLSARQVFASDFSLYFPTLPGHTPRTNGSWLRLDGARYNERVPEICVTTVDCLLADARRSGITHLVLTPDAQHLSAELGRLYTAPGYAGLVDRGRASVFRVFRIS
jgi:hypothetical protein